MRIAIISDIHANYFYLEKIVDEINKRGIDQVYCLGDIIGYYDDPNACVELVKELCDGVVQGNHESYLLEEENYDLNKENSYKIKEHRLSLSSENLNYLKSLPKSLNVELDGKKLLFTHAKLGNNQAYIYSASDLDKKELDDLDYYFFGHTHLPFVTYHYGTCIINPGSVGQPRDYSQKPSFAILDIVKEEISIHKVSISNSLYIRRLKDKDYDKSVIDILIR